MPPGDVVPLDRSKRETDGGCVGVHVLLITAVHQLAQLSHPVVAFIANVPQQAQPATRAQDAHRPEAGVASLPRLRIPFPLAEALTIP